MDNHEKVDPEEIIEKLKRILAYLQNKKKESKSYNAKEFSNTP